EEGTPPRKIAVESPRSASRLEVRPGGDRNRLLHDRTLRAWNQAVAVGAPEVLPDLARDLQKEQGLVAVLRRLILREGDN
ncbi:MAG: hypothetical protein O7A71_10200, partial [Chloroflexi bacterium]|nr:hypothetical protein [Chloroflexota bacterium]